MSVKKSTNTFNKIYSIVKNIPSGKVATYGQIAALVGPGMPARIVGFALHGISEDLDIPWHRVINSQGKISYSIPRSDGDSLQKILLENEGVLFNASGRIDLQKYLWRPDRLNN
jgi:methylated-DNA-protein-cysteine methyltransferase-like protein